MSDAPAREWRKECGETSLTMPAFCAGPYTAAVAAFIASLTAGR